MGFEEGDGEMPIKITEMLSGTLLVWSCDLWSKGGASSVLEPWWAWDFCGFLPEVYSQWL